MRGISLKLVESYLTNRYQYVEAGGCCKSVTLPITAGDPQGNVLGPFLFLVYINDFANCFEDAQLVLYADDAVLMKTLSGFMPKTQTNLNAAIEWTRSNALAFNSNKTKFIKFANTTDYPYPNIKINIGEIAIHPQETFHYLGVTIDSQWKWKEHTQLVTKKCVSCGIVKKIHNYLPFDILYLRISITVLLILIYNMASRLGVMPQKKHSSKIQVMQNRVIKIMTKSNQRKTKLSPIYARLSVLQLDKIYQLEMIKHVQI